MFKGGLGYALVELAIVVILSAVLMFGLHNALAALMLWVGVFLSDSFFAAVIFKSMNKKNK